jgi:hypothetical protein
MFSGKVTMFSGKVTMFSRKVEMFSRKVNIFSGKVKRFSGKSKCSLEMSKCALDMCSGKVKLFPAKVKIFSGKSKSILQYAEPAESEHKNRKQKQMSRKMTESIFVIDWALSHAHGDSATQRLGASPRCAPIPAYEIRNYLFPLLFLHS